MKPCSPSCPTWQSITASSTSDGSDGHTNTIEGFWGLLKRAWYGQHHHYRRQYSPLYVAEATWKYNHRQDVNGFGSFMRGVFA